MSRHKSVMKTKHEEYTKNELADRHHIDIRVWGNQKADDLAKYIDWHAKHPHCSTPRTHDFEDRGLTGAQVVDESDPSKVYTIIPPIKPLPEEYCPKLLGIHGSFGDVGVASLSYENEHKLQHMEFGLFNDPWYEQSVKDQIHSDHTVHKSLHAPKEFAPSRDHPLKRIPPATFQESILNPKAAKNLELLAVRESHERHGKHPKQKISPFVEPYSYTKYTKDGTFMDDFKKRDFERIVGEALKAYELDSAAYEKKTLKHTVDPYLELGDKLGTEEEREKMGTQWNKYAEKVRKQAKTDAPFFDPSLDLIDACNRLNVIKVMSFLMTGSDPNVVIDNQPLFMSLFLKALNLDTLTDSLKPGDEETSDRKKLQRIITEFMKYVDINMKGNTGHTALHLAAIRGNAKMVSFLLDKGVDVTKVSRTREGNMSALAYAGKFAHVDVIALIVKHMGPRSLQEVDENGWSVLHHCAAAGQTRACMFLIRIGADKRLKDNEGRAPGIVAQELGHTATAQEIFTFARHPPTAQRTVDYLMEKTFPETTFAGQVIDKLAFLLLIACVRIVFAFVFVQLASDTIEFREPVYRLCRDNLAFFAPLPRSRQVMEVLAEGFSTVGAAIASVGNAAKDLFRGLMGRAQGNIRIEPMPAAKGPTGSAGGDPGADPNAVVPFDDGGEPGP